MLSRVRPGSVLGTMEFGRGPCSAAVAKEMTESFLSYDKSYRHLDTALMYSGGKSETIIGDMACWRDQSGVVDTKINPWDNKNYGEESIRSQVESCLGRLKVKKVGILYLHAPDHKTPLEQTLKTMNSLYEEGKFDQLGLSNYSAWLVAEVVNVCKVNTSNKFPLQSAYTVTFTGQ